MISKQQYQLIKAWIFIVLGVLVFFSAAAWDNVWAQFGVAFLGAWMFWDGLGLLVRKEDRRRR